MRSASRTWSRAVGAAAIVFTVSAGAAVTSSAQTGASVLEGVYTEEQAKRGEAVSAKLCASCHGPDLSGGEAGPALVGLEFIGNWTNLTVADFFDRVHSTMPADAPGTMTPQQTSDVSAYVLKLNKYPAGKVELPSDLGALKGIKIEGPR
jgi:S-disulfanyl-L-cysteine oxidoreductase SoxD